MSEIITWIHKNLFSSLLNSILTCVALYILYLTIPGLVSWAVLDANFFGSGPESCTKDGACWVFIGARFNQFMYGFYPIDQQWRINISYLLAITALLGFFSAPSYRKQFWLYFMFIVFPIIAFILYYGGVLGLPVVATYQWGGLHLTLVVAFTGIVGSLPIGILLAMGRRSSLPVVRILCTAFIELWRAVPLISVLFMASVMLPLFFADGAHIDKLLRALIGITLFAAAYMAEVIRGGLQAIPKGQYEAAQSLGIKYWPMFAFIILPQALKISIPNIVNTFIALFKDTTLVLIIGLFDFLGIVQAANSDPRWIAFGLDGYVFAAIVFWTFCFSMSRYSILLEKKLTIGRNK